MINDFLNNKSVKVNKRIIEKIGYSSAEFFLLLGIYFNKGKPITPLLESLSHKGDTITISDEIVEISPLGETSIETILTHSDNITEKAISETNNYLELAKIIQEEFPKGRKQGTNYNWRGSTAVNAARLKTLVKKYNITLTADNVRKATQNYIKSFNGNYTYMQLLKYFIFKNVIKDGEVELESQLMSYIENLGQENEENNEWTATLK